MKILNILYIIACNPLIVFLILCKPRLHNTFIIMNYFISTLTKLGLHFSSLNECSLIIWMLCAWTSCCKVQSHCSLYFLSTLITKICFASPAFEMVIVVVFFKTLLMTAGTQFSPKLFLGVCFQVTFYQYLSFCWFPGRWVRMWNFSATISKMIITTDCLSWVMHINVNQYR